MSLILVSTPIGNHADISERAIQTLRSCDLVVGEERSETSKLLKRLNLSEKPFELLNEHSTKEDLQAILKSCSSKTVALVTDCGTPGFCDPGADLVHLCRKENVPVTSVPGASSLMTAISLSGYKLKEFIFRGFLPAESGERRKAIEELVRERRACFVMDTPYRLSKLLSELASSQGERRAVIFIDLTQPSETVQEASLRQLADKFSGRKGEFMLMLVPSPAQKTSQGARRPYPQKS